MTIRMCVCVLTYVHIYANIYAYIHTHTFMCVYIIYVCIYVHMYVNIYMCVCICVCVGAGRRHARRALRNAAVMQRKLNFCQQVFQDLGFRGSGLGSTQRKLMVCRQGLQIVPLQCLRVRLPCLRMLVYLQYLPAVLPPPQHGNLSPSLSTSPSPSLPLFLPRSHHWILASP